MNLIIILFTGDKSDVTIILQEERLSAHFLVLYARCKKICDDIVTINESKYLEMWSHLSKKVVVSFISYIYSGIIDLELISSEDISSAKYFSENYPDLEGWGLYVKNFIDQIE